MREILFKAKRLYNGQWVEGYPFPSRPGGELDRMIVFEGLPGGSTMSVVEIDPATVCQSTGLTDKNGVKVFEGDVILHDTKHPIMSERIDKGTMFFDQESLSFKRTATDGNVYRINHRYKMDYEVIGNIHDKEDANGKNEP